MLLYLQLGSLFETTGLKNEIMLKFRIASGCLLLLVLFSIKVTGQEKVNWKGPGYIEYLDGNMPLLISVPHGGYLIPGDIPGRTGNVALNQDIFTIEIAYMLREYVAEKTGKYPYIVISHLHRTRLDVNRNISEAAGGNPKAEEVWQRYHFLLDSISEVITKDFGSGLLIDLHGHRHSVQQIELGYLLSADELHLSDEMLDSGLLNEFLSIRHLAASGRQPVSGLVRGYGSLGELLHESGEPVMPCRSNPFPKEGEPYFSGGYTSMRHGSSEGGRMDAIQIELSMSSRKSERSRKKLAGHVGSALTSFMELYYPM